MFSEIFVVEMKKVAGGVVVEMKSVSGGWNCRFGSRNGYGGQNYPILYYSHICTQQIDSVQHT